MKDLVRETPLGQFLRWATKNRVLKYPEEEPDFVLPKDYAAALKTHMGSQSDLRGAAARDARKPSDPDTLTDSDKTEKDEPTDPSPYQQDPELGRRPSRESTRAYTEERLQVDERDAIERTTSKPIVPTRTEEGHILVDWYTTDDPANPQNWTLGKKVWVAFVLCLYTFVVYTGSAIYTSSIPQLETVFHINDIDGSLPLSLYVLAYGIGPLIFSPLT